MAMTEGNGKRRVVIVNPAQYPCPACGRTDRWEGAFTTPGKEGAMTVWCDCGIGEIIFVVQKDVGR